MILQVGLLLVLLMLIVAVISAFLAAVLHRIG